MKTASSVSSPSNLEHEFNLSVPVASMMGAPCQKILKLHCIDFVSIFFYLFLATQEENPNLGRVALGQAHLAQTGEDVPGSRTTPRAPRGRGTTAEACPCTVRTAETCAVAIVPSWAFL
jgi:hypothetical protein